MTSIRINPETHQNLKKVATKHGSKLTGLLAEVASLLVNTQLSPSQLQAKLEAASQMHSFQKLLTEQIAQVLKVMGQQERNYLFPFSKELALLQGRTEQLAAREDCMGSLADMNERLQHVEELIQRAQQTLDKQYQLLMEV